MMRDVRGPESRAAALLLLILILFLNPSPGCSRDGVDLRTGFESGRYRTIVAFGDSIVEGYRQPEGWPEMLERELAAIYPGTRIANAGVSGDTAGDGVRRLDRDVLGHRPDLVLISFGLNDMKNGVPQAQFQLNLSTILDGIAAAGAQPVLLTTTRLQQGAALLARLNPAHYNEAVRILAEERDVPLIDLNEESKGLNTASYLMDVAHPNREGYKVLAAIIKKGLLGE